MHSRWETVRPGDEKDTPPVNPPAAWKIGRALRRLLFRNQHDLDAAVLGAAFGRGVVGHRLELTEGGGRELGGLDALLLQIVRDVDRPRRRQLPVGRIALEERADDRLVVRMALDADRLVVHRLENLDDLAENHQPVLLHLRLAGVEQDGVYHVDGEPPLQLGDRDLSFVDLALHLLHELLVGRADLAHLLLARFVRRGQVALERADALAQLDDGLALLARLRRERALELSIVGRELLAALLRVGEVVLEARVLRLESVVPDLGGVERHRVLAPRDAGGGAEGDEGQSGDGQKRLAHRDLREMAKPGVLPAKKFSSTSLWQRTPGGRSEA